MSKRKKAGDSDALGDFRLLEERIGRLLTVLAQVREEREVLTGRLRETRNQVQELESEIRGLRKDRKIVRTRIQDMIREIAELEHTRENGRREDEEKRVV
jgi:cell division protein FtsB